MAPVYLHLHLVLPSPFLFRRVRHRFLAVLYGVAVILAVLELFQALPFTAYFFGFLTAILGSLVLLILRWWVRRTPVERQATRLMTTGILLAFGPLLILHASFLLALQAYIQLTTMIFLVLLVPVLPMFYAYAAFKRYLGAMEVRANRLLGLYSFGLLYVTVYLLVLLPSRWWFDTPPGMLLYSLGTSTVFVLAAPALQARFQRFFNRIAYGARHDPTELLILFAQRIPAVQDYRALADMLADEILPTLLIRQSALYVGGGRGIQPGVVPGDLPGGEDDASGADPGAPYRGGPLPGTFPGDAGRKRLGPSGHPPAGPGPPGGRVALWGPGSRRFLSPGRRGPADGPGEPSGH
jgi:hypothetical protein